VIHKTGIVLEVNDYTLNWPRNVETMIGSAFAGEGNSFNINLTGSK